MLWIYSKPTWVTFSSFILDSTKFDFCVALLITGWFNLPCWFRLGVSAFGYEDNGVENLRCKLSGFLSRDATIRMALPVQIALATALLGLLSLDFEKLIQSNSCLPAMSRQSVSIDHIRSWFSSLTKEQQALSLSLLPSSDVRWDNYIVAIRTYYHLQQCPFSSR